MTHPFVAPDRAGRSPPTRVPSAAGFPQQGAGNPTPDFARYLKDEPRQDRSAGFVAAAQQQPAPPPLQPPLLQPPSDALSSSPTLGAQALGLDGAFVLEQPAETQDDEAREAEGAGAPAFLLEGGGPILNFLARLAPPPPPQERSAPVAGSAVAAQLLVPPPDAPLAGEGGSPEAAPPRVLQLDHPLQAPVHREASPPPALLAASLETHLEPAGVQPVYLQVAQRIDGALAPSLGDAGAPTAAAPHLLPEASKAPLQVLRLQLQPAELGAVDIRLHLRAGEIHVRVAVESAEARLQLQTGVEKLGAALREKGYEVQSIVIAQDVSSTRQQESQHRAGRDAPTQDSPSGESGQQAQRDGFAQRERSDRREHARGRNDRAGDDLERFAG